MTVCALTTIVSQLVISAVLHLVSSAYLTWVQLSRTSLSIPSQYLPSSDSLHFTFNSTGRRIRPDYANLPQIDFLLTHKNDSSSFLAMKFMSMNKIYSSLFAVKVMNEMR